MKTETVCRKQFADACITLTRLLFLLLVLPAVGQEHTPIKLHPDNPHYFLWRGQPTILITSTEHYGAVLNLDFDFIPYLDELRSHGFNLTRVFSGSYREIKGSFNLKENTLAPKPSRFIAPWARSSSAGAVDGQNKFDLAKWDPAYFDRLKNFVAEADKRGIVVEYVFFCTMYGEELWQASPMNSLNNINDIGKVGRYEVYSVKEKALQDIQEAFVRKIVTELNPAPNLYFEICNEAYERGGLTREWNDRVVAAIHDTESTLPNRHLIAQGFPPDPPRIENPNPQISIFNFHVVNPRCLSENYHYKRPIADDETGGKGIHPLPYRREAWEFILGGGAVVDHLDFSFTVNHPKGTFPLTDEPGGGGPEIRAQLAILKKFLESFEFIRMRPDRSSVRVVRPGVTATTLSQPGVAYAVYLHGSAPFCELELSLGADSYRAEWLDPKSGKVLKVEKFLTSGHPHQIVFEGFAEDIVLRLRRDSP